MADAQKSMMRVDENRMTASEKNAHASENAGSAQLFPCF
jgi:hypothetical protein